MKCSTSKTLCCCLREIAMPGLVPCAKLKRIRINSSPWPSRPESMPGSTPGKRAPGAFCRGYHKPYEHSHHFPESIPDALEDRCGRAHKPGADLWRSSLGFLWFSESD